MIAIQAILFVLLGLAGTALVLTRNPTKQAIVSGLYGLLLSIIFMALNAPDVSLAAVVVGAIGMPMMILYALSRVREPPG